MAAATDAASTVVAAMNGAGSLATDSLDAVLAEASGVVRCTVEAGSTVVPKVEADSTVVADHTVAADHTAAAHHTAAATVVDTGNEVSG
jgi:hypothetical protein